LPVEIDIQPLGTIFHRDDLTGLQPSHDSCSAERLGLLRQIGACGLSDERLRLFCIAA